jgi:hypothetical protein
MMSEWLRLAVSPSIVWRAVKVALVVGTILIAINYGDLILAGHVGGAMWVKMALTLFVPYGVSTYSSVGALMETERRRP